MYHFLSQLPDLDLPRQTAHRIRKGQGRLTVLTAALRAAGCELRPTPETLARATDKIGQRETARRAGIARATVAALASGQGTIKSYAALAAALKVSPKIAKRKSYAACMSSKDQTWQTPRILLDAILAAAGREAFDLDPCSPRADGPVPALERWTEADDGLTRPWSGLVFVNPPYSRVLPRWVAKCAQEASAGTTVIGLVPSRTDTRWWHNSVAGRSDIIMIKGRLKFSGRKMAAPFPSALVVWNDSALAQKIAAALPGAWLIARKAAA
jgi:phage N-6-adenine-methyltransferase